MNNRRDPIHLFLAWKYLRARKRFFGLSNLLSLLGITLGVSSILIVVSVMNGFSNYITERVTESRSEIIVSAAAGGPLDQTTGLVKQINNFPRVKAATPITSADLILQSDHKMVPTICQGIDPRTSPQVLQLFDQVVVGHPVPADLENNGIMLGLDLASDLLVTVGNYIVVSSPRGTEPSAFGLLPRTMRLRVVGLIQSSLPEYDRLFSYVSLANANRLKSSTGMADMILVKTGEPHRSIHTANRLQKALGTSYRVENWSQFDKTLFASIKMEKIVMITVLSLMFVIVAFNMSGSFIRLVTEKKNEIGILKALGYTDIDIRRMILLWGVIIGIIGTLTGVVLALIVLYCQIRWNLVGIPVAGFPIKSMPVDMRFWDFMIIPGIALMMSFLTGFTPARRAMRADPIDTIRKR